MTTTTLLNHTTDLVHKRPPFGEPDMYGIPAFVIWNILIVLVIALIFYWLLRSASKKETALDILKKRYASGEIDKERFDEMKKDIGE